VLAAAVVAVGLLGGGVALGGSQQFTDAGPSHPFFDEIEQFGGAGISGGFPDGTYRPGTPVSRAAMAAFMTRGLPNLGYATGTTAQTIGASQITVNTVSYVVPGELGGGGQHLIINATATWRMNSDTKAAACADAATEQCEFVVGVYNNGNLVHDVIGRVVAGNDGGTLSINAVLPNQPTGVERTITLRAEPGTNLGSGFVQLTNRQIVVTNAPFFEGGA
jgi:hypothetical protein